MLSLAIVLLTSMQSAPQSLTAVPSASARAGAQAALLDALAALAVTGTETPVVERLLAVAQDAADPALRFELLLHARRCAVAAHDVQATALVVDALAATFAVDVAEQFATSLEMLQARAPLAAQRRAGAWLASARRVAPGSGDLAVRLRGAREAAAADQPPGLRALVERTCAQILGLRLAHELPPARRALDLEQQGAQQDDALLLLQAAESWLSMCREWPEGTHAVLRRRALGLLGKVVHAHLPSMLGARALPEIEAKRAQQMYEQLADQLAHDLGCTWRFADAAALRGWHISDGAWRVVDGALRGEDQGSPTRATAPFAFAAIDCVTIRGGLVAGHPHNLRLAVGDVNLLLNWEVADENHLYSGDRQNARGPRALTPGREHVIRLCQFDELVVVLVDGREVLYQIGRLRGPVTVYPELGSQIVVRSIEVVGDLDLDHVVTGPSGATR